MIHYFGKNLTATTAGRRIEEVICEKCATQYYYELLRMGVGEASAPYYLFQNSASDRARRAAARDMAHRLDREAELVPCPSCNWVNQDLVVRYRRRLYRRAPWLGLILMIAGLIAAPVAAAVLTDSLGHRSSVPRVTMVLIIALSLLCPSCVLWIRSLLRRRINPNETYPRQPRVPLGTPPALMTRRDSRTGEHTLEPAVKGLDQQEQDNRWLIFRPGELRFPRICCVCLGSASTSYSSPFKVSEGGELEVPLCGRCAWRLRYRWWMVALAVATATTALAALPAAALPRLDHTGRWMLFGTSALFMSIFAVAILPNRICRPYRLRILDRDRGIVRFAAANPRFTELLVRRVRGSENGKHVPAIE